MKWALLALALWGGVGCASEHQTAVPIRTGNEARAYIVRGFRDWYSDGLCNLGAQLRSSGVDAQGVPEADYLTLEHALLRSTCSPVVLIGFSYGADDVITIARALHKAGRPVALLIVIDPVTPAAIPPNVFRCIDYYQSNGLWDVFPFLRGVRVHRGAEDDQPLSNVSLRRTPTLLEPNTSHATIAGNQKVHDAVVAQVLATYHLEAR